MIHPDLWENLYREEIYKVKPKALIVINKPWSDISAEESILLEKILKASKLSLASVQIVTRSSFSAEDFKVFSPPFIIAFGSTLENSDKMYASISTGETNVIVAHELSELDDERKRNLWITLKQAFHF